MSTDLQGGILAILKGMIPVEIIDGSNVEETAKMVDLDIEYQPVIPNPVDSDLASLGYGGRVPIPCRVQMEGSRWCVWIPHTNEKYRWVTDDELKVMRARFLLLKGVYYRQIQNMPHSLQQEVVSKFFPGGLFKPQAMLDMDSKSTAEVEA